MSAGRCEWGAFEQIASRAEDTALLGTVIARRIPRRIPRLNLEHRRTAACAQVELLVMEMHVTPTLPSPSPEQFVTFFELVFKRLGFRSLPHGVTPCQSQGH